MRSYITVFCLALSLSLVGACAPEIGDPCGSSLDCPERATCDTTASGGYCLIFDCDVDENNCPDDSVCVPFRNFTACMKHCGDNGDCRTDDGMTCRTDIEPYTFCYEPEAEP